MPKEVYAPLIEMELVRNEKALEDIITNIVKLGDKLGHAGCCNRKCSLFK